jgi:hypothetical protein
MDLQKRFYVAMAAYAVLALLAWFVMDATTLPGGGGEISLRGLTLILLGFFAARTILQWNADRIRAQKERQEQAAGVGR